jgi:hypothetical protein
LLPAIGDKHLLEEPTRPVAQFESAFIVADRFAREDNAIPTAENNDVASQEAAATSVSAQLL